MSRYIQIGLDFYEVEDRKPRKGETFLNITGYWKVAEKDYDFLVLPVLIGKHSEEKYPEILPI